MNEDLRDTIAGDILSLMPFYHKHIIRSGHGLTGLQMAQYRVLGVLMKSGALSMSEIGRRLYISKPYMTALVDALIGEGLVERQRDPTDRRVVNITITPKGKRHVKQFFLLFKNDLCELLGGIGSEDLKRLRASLKDLKSVLLKLA